MRSLALQAQLSGLSRPSMQNMLDSCGPPRPRSRSSRGRRRARPALTLIQRMYDGSARGNRMNRDINAAWKLHALAHGGESTHMESSRLVSAGYLPVRPARRSVIPGARQRVDNDLAESSVGSQGSLAGTVPAAGRMVGPTGWAPASINGSRTRCACPYHSIPRAGAAVGSADAAVGPAPDLLCLIPNVISNYFAPIGYAAYVH